MLDKIEMYIGQGLYYLKSSIAIALIIYSIILATLWIIGNRNSIKTKLIPINKLIFEYLLVLNIIVILWSYVNILDTKSQTFLCCTSS